MRPKFKIELEQDRLASQKWSVVLYGPDGSRLAELGRNMEQNRAELLLVPCRKAFLAGVEWLRQDASSYIETITPNVICGRSEMP